MLVWTLDPTRRLHLNREQRLCSIRSTPLKITYFPEIRPGELFASVIMRMLWHQGETSSLTRFFRHWQKPALRFSAVFVPPMAPILKQVPDSWDFDPDWFIHSCCILPFLSPFVSPDIRRKHLDWVYSEGSARRAPVLRGIAGIFPPGTYRICPDCVAKDKSLFGEAYLHRIHSLPGINFCLEHCRRLISIGNNDTPLDVLMRRIEIPGRSADGLVDFVPASLLLNLRNSIERLFARRIEATERLDFKRIYRYRLDVMGINRTGWDEELIAALYRKYGRKVAEVFRFDDWSKLIKRYLGGNQEHLPAIGHLIVQDFLELSFSDAIEYANGSLWKCANPFTDCGRALTPRRQMSSNSGTAERVECPKCGFDARVARTSALGSKPSIRSIIRRGPVFEEYLLRSIEEGISIEQLSERSGLAGRTIRRILNALDHGRGKWRIVPSELREEIFVRTRDAHRGAYLDYIRTHFGITRSELAVRISNETSWLRANDRDWYESHAPAALPKHSYFARRAAERRAGSGISSYWADRKLRIFSKT